LPALLDEPAHELPPRLIATLLRLHRRYGQLGNEIAEIETDLKAQLAEDEAAQRLLTIPGIGPITASSLIAVIGDAHAFRHARDFAASLGLVPRQHSTGGRATLPFVPIVVDLAGPTPVLAAGGIADGRGVAAALALGAAGALIGTRFQVTTEALVAAEVTKAIIEGRGEDTERSRILDIARGAPWPARYPARTLRNAFLDRWRGRETELESDEEAKASFRDAAHRGDLDVLPVWASESIDLITEALPAAELVSLLVSEAEQALMRAGRAVTPTGHINGRGDAVHPA